MKEKREINITIGNQIKIARETAGLTQERFAELISLGPKNVSDIERGVVGISVGTLIRICKTLSVSSDSILFGFSNENDANHVAQRLGKLSSEQFEIAIDIINKLFEAFASSGHDGT